jgi:DNA-binding response OmpR family regulator
MEMAANRILLVEDDHAIADAVALNLRTVGYEVVFFDDGGIASDSLKTDHSYDLALLDIMLPGMDGFELFARMEKYNIPVIYMTARTDSESEVRGLRDGAEDYIVKPFAIVTLLVRIEKVLARTGRLNQVIVTGISPWMRKTAL